MGEPAKVLGQEDPVAEAERVIADGYRVLRTCLLLTQASPDRSAEFRRHFEQAQFTFRQIEILEGMLRRVEH